ncbi:MAG: TonB-dependent receptor [Myxococcales bacterium]|nr:TonB-dependent receptor [Myxococcales bacterium]
MSERAFLLHAPATRPLVLALAFALVVTGRAPAQADDELDALLDELEEAPPPPRAAPGGREASVDAADLTLREVVVTGTRREGLLADTPVATEVISRDEIERSGAETLAELLEEQPGIDIFASVRGQGLRLRGLEPEHTLFLVDGERTIGRMNGVLDLTRWQLDDVERVEIVRGAASALWGSDALGGVINVIPREARRGWMAEGRATYGYQDRRRSNPRARFQGGPRVDDDGTTLPRDAYGGTYDLTSRLGWSNERGGVTAFLGYHRLDGFDLDPRDAATTGPATETWNTGGGAWLRIRRAKVRLGGEYLIRNDDAQESRGRVVLDRLNRTEQARISLAPEIPTRKGILSLRGSLTMFRDQFLRQVRGGEQLAPPTDTRERLLQLQARYVHVASDRNITTLGYDTSLEMLQTPRLERDGARARVAPYLQHEWTPSETPYLSIVPGVRFDADSWFGTALSPKLAVRFDPHEKLVLRTSGGRGFRAPDFRELLLNFNENASIGYVVVGNADLRPESSWSADLGVEVRAHATTWVSVTAYWNRVADLITTDLVGEEGGVQTFTYVNVGDARTAGVEAMLRLRPLATRRGPHRLHVDLGYTYLHARDLVNQRDLPGRARHWGTLHARYRHVKAGFEVLWRSSLTGPRSFTGGDGPVRTESTLALDLRVEKSFADDRYRVFVGADNVLNNGGIYLPLRPRTFWGGVAARY